VKHLYKKYPLHDPHHLTNLKCAIITNHFLSNLCVKIGLHRFIRYFSVSLPAAIANYVTCLEDRKLTKGKNEFWLELEAPKVSPPVVGIDVGVVRYCGGHDGGYVS
jgi:endoribonuclease Dicer